MTEEKIQRINDLYHKSKAEGLTEQEKKEQEFIADVRGSLRRQLDNIDIVEKDGSVHNLGETYGHNKKSTS